MKRVPASATHIFSAELIGGQMHGAVRAATNLFHYDELVDPMICPPVGLVVCELNACVQGLLSEW